MNINNCKRPIHNVVVEADVDQIYTENIDRVLGAITVASYADGPIALTPETLKRAGALFREGSEFIPYMIVLQGLLSISWGGFFVELYRCLEQLFAVPRLRDLTKDWKTERSIRALAELLEKRLSWRPKEDDSLTKVLSCCDETAITDIVAAFELTLDENSEPIERAAREIYNLRNSLVHFRAANEMSEMAGDQWDNIIRSMLEVVSQTYGEYGELFHEEIVANTSVGENDAQPVTVVPEAPGSAPVPV